MSDCVVTDVGSSGTDVWVDRDLPCVSYAELTPEVRADARAFGKVQLSTNALISLGKRLRDYSPGTAVLIPDKEEGGDFFYLAIVG